MNSRKVSTIIAVLVLALVAFAISKDPGQFWTGLFDTVLPIGDSTKAK